MRPERPRRSAGWLRARAAALGLVQLALCLLAPVAHAHPIDGQQHIELSGVTFVVDRDSGTELIVWSERAHYDPVLQSVHLEEVNLQVGEGAGEGGLVLRCQRGVISLDSNHFRLEGDVTGRLADGRRFEAEWLEYDEAAQRLFSADPVTIRDAKGAFRGGGLEYEIGPGRIRLFDGARVVERP